MGGGCFSGWDGLKIGSLSSVSSMFSLNKVGTWYGGLESRIFC